MSQFFKVDEIIDGIHYTLQTIDLENDDFNTNQVIISNLSPFYLYQVNPTFPYSFRIDTYKDGCDFTSKSVLEKEMDGNFSRIFSIVNIQNLNNQLHLLFEEEVEKSKKMKVPKINLQPLTSLLRCVGDEREQKLFYICNLIGIDFDKIKGDCYFPKSGKIVREVANKSLKQICSDLNDLFKSKLITTLGLEIKPYNPTSSYTNLITFTENLHKLSKFMLTKVEYENIIDLIKERSFKFDSNGYERKSGLEIVKELDKKNLFYFLKKIVK